MQPMQRLTDKQLRSALERGLILISSSKIAQLVGCSEASVRRWREGKTVSAALDAAIRRALAGQSSRTLARAS